MSASAEPPEMASAAAERTRSFFIASLPLLACYEGGNGARSAWFPDFWPVAGLTFSFRLLTCARLRDLTMLRNLQAKAPGPPAGKSIGAVSRLTRERTPAWPRHPRRSRMDRGRADPCSG